MMGMLDHLLEAFAGAGARAPQAAMFSGQADADLMPPSTNDPQAREPEVFSAGVPIPRPRPVTPNTPASVPPTGGLTDVSSANVPLSFAPPAPSPVAAPQAQGGGIGGFLGNMLKPENAPLFMSLAGGLSGAPSLGTGMRRAFAGATPAAMQLQQQQKLQQSQAETYRALIARGVSPQEAMASIRNPDIMKATVAKYFETRPAQIVNNRLVREKPGGGIEVLADYSDDKDKPRQQVTIKTASGAEVPGSFDPKSGKYFDVAGKEVAAGDLGGGGADIYKALLERGVSETEAKAALANPEIMKGVAMRAFGTRALQHVMKEDAFGNKVPMSFDPSTGKWYDQEGKIIDTGVSSEISSSGRGSSADGSGLGMGPVNSDLVGEDYLAQFPKEVQAAVRNYVAGNSMPTGNPRKGFTQAVKMIAQKYGEDTGTPVSDQRYVEKKNYRNQLASGTAGIGLQRNSLRQALHHAEAMADSAVKLGNYNLWLKSPSHWLNSLRGQSTEQAGKVNEFTNNVQTMAGEVGKFFSGPQGGGVHERALTRERFDAAGSPPEIAGALESTLELLEGGLRAREAQRDELFGPNSGIELLSKDDLARIERIKNKVEQLRGRAPSSKASAAPSTGTPSGKTGSGLNWRVVE